jgi:hypothetical protein
MVAKIISACLIIAAVIHLMPLAGLAGADKLTKLYGIQVQEPNLLILMQHRAVLFGLLGAFLSYAVFVPAAQIAAVTVGVISAVAFLVLARITGDYNAALARVVMADIIAIGALTLAAGLIVFRYMRS